MEAYRDQYATLFNNGKKVVVLAVSVDPDTTLFHWARESSFPFLMGQDVGVKVGQAYASANPNTNLRNLFVIGPDGKIAYRVIRFNVSSADAYTDLGKAVAQTLGGSGH